MLASLERVRDLVTRPTHTYRPSLETFADLDTQRVGAGLKLSEKGVADGRQNVPPADAEAFGSVETEIIEHIGATQKRAHDQLENHLAGFRQRLIDLDFETRFANIKRAAAGGLSDLEAELGKGLDELHGLRRDLSEHEDWQRDFRAKHRITRPARITSTRGTILKWLLIVLIVVIELLVNGELLSKGNELGLVGGIVEALIFACLNVGVALLFALYAVPLITHRSFFAKLLGAVSVAAYLACMLAINLGLAHYREVAGAILLGGDVNKVGKDVMDRLATRPLVLDEFKSWLLFALGCVFSLVAFIDGLNLRDSYPQYARVSKSLRQARERYLGKRQDLIDELQTIRAEADDQFAEARSNLSKERTEHDAIVAHRQRMLSLFDEHQTQLERAANALLSQYRDANRATRSNPPPVRFAQNYALPRTAVQISKEGEWNAEDLKTSIKAAQDELDGLMKELGTKFSEALKRYRELDIIAPDK